MIFLYAHGGKPFLNVDGDVYIFKRIPDEIYIRGINSPRILEQDFEYYKNS